MTDVTNQISKFSESGNINGLIEFYNELYNNSDNYKKVEINRAIQNILKNEDYAVRITPASLKLIEGITKTKLKSKYSPVSAITGRTYLLLTTPGKDDGVAFFINITKDEKAREIPAEVLDAVCAAIIEFKNPTLIFNREIYKDLRYEFVNYNNQPLPFLIRGRSFELPLAVALFSHIVNIPVPAEFAFSAQLSGKGNLSLVRGGEIKINSLKREYPEVKKAILPEMLQNSFKSPIPGVEINFVSTLNEVLKITFSKNMKPGKLDSFLGKVELILKKEGKSGLRIVVKSDSWLQTSIIPQIESVLDNLKFNSATIIIECPYAVWLTVKIALYFKNRIKILAVKDTRLGDVVIFSSDNKLKPGDILSLE